MKETEDIVILKKHQFNIYIFSAIILFVAFLGFTIYWEVSYHTTLSKLVDSGTYVKTEAIVFDHTTISNKTYDVIHFVVDDVEVERVYFEPSNHNKGTKVLVYYESANPTFGGLFGYNTMVYWLPVLTVLLGGIEGGLLYLYYNMNIAKYNTTQKAKKPSKKGNNKK